MKCKNCGAQIPQGGTICPVCKQKNEKKKLSTGATIGISVALVLIVVGVFLAIFLLGDKDDTNLNTPTQNPGTSASGQQSTQGGTSASGQQNTQTGNSGITFEKKEGSFTVPASAVNDAMLKTVVATCGDQELTNELLSYYYWYGYSSYVNYYGEVITQYLDVTKPLDSQYYDQGETTWQQFFLDMALESYHYAIAMCNAAQAAGFTLADSYETYLADIETSLNSYAQQYSYASGEDYLRACFGARATVDGYREYMRQYLTSMSYSIVLQSELSFTEEEVEAYYDENVDTFLSGGVKKDDTRLVNVRHILLEPSNPESDAAWDEAEQTANDIYDTWKNNPTEDYFAQLANTYSTDTGSNTTGGMYESVYPGEMVQEFNDWCFDAARQVGDSAIVKTSYGYHIMYFCGHGELFWRFAAYSNLASETYTEKENQILEDNAIEIDYEDIILVDPVGMYAQ